MTSRSRSPSRGRARSLTRSMSPRSDVSRSPVRQRRHDSRSHSRSLTPPPRRNGRYRSNSRSWSRGRRRDSRDRSESPVPRSTKIVVERLSKNINQDHLYEIFGQFGSIKDLDLPMNRTFGTNRGTAYILFDHEADAESAISHMHEAQVDGAIINVSIVLPRRKLSPPPPTARRGANIDPRVPMSGPRGGPSSRGGGFHTGGGRRRQSPPPPSSRYGPRSDVYRPPSRSPSRSPGGALPSRVGGGGRYRSRSVDSYSSRSRSRSPVPRKRGGGGGGSGVGGNRYDVADGRHRTRSRSIGSHAGRSRSRSARGYR
ncbi:hypothetical protein E4U43_002183 [Claviceps pusilla]|uniref:RRM domain-containing protein n=1 Tax=Claviceps pusilla TaxID=123648 RepID=A0A9P7N775_9HYPO|nr:hypothetical protein E4U43_002183 [Claviceps pusilla]